MVTTGGYLRGSRLYKTSGTMGRGVAELHSQLSIWKCGNVETRDILTYRRTNILNYYYGEELYI